jgi:ClpP class serine protease
MSIGDLFWVFFMFTALQPMLQQRMLNAMRTRKIAQLERQRNSRVILLVHRQETMRLLGFPLARYIDINDSTSSFTRRAVSYSRLCRSPTRSATTRPR